MFGCAHRVGAYCALRMSSESSNAPLLRCEVLVPRTEAAGVADAMIEAEFPIRTAHKYAHWWPEGYSGMTATL